MIKIRKKQFNEKGVLRLPVLTNKGLTVKESISMILEMDNSEKALQTCDNLKEAYATMQSNKKLPQMEGKSPNTKKAMLQALCSKDWNLEKQCFYKDMVCDLGTYKVNGVMLDMISFHANSEKNEIDVYHQSQLILPNGYTVTSMQVSHLGTLPMDNTVFLGVSDLQALLDDMSDSKACKRIIKTIEDLDTEGVNIPNLKKYQSDIIDGLKLELNRQVERLAINSNIYDKMNNIDLLLD